MKKIDAKYNYRTVIERNPDVKVVDLFVELNLPENALKEIKYFRVFE